MLFQFNSNIVSGINVISLKGELIDKMQANEMLTEIEKYITSSSNQFILDMSELKYLNSSGLGILISILTKVRKAGGEVLIAGVTKKVNELLIITKLNGVFNVCENVEDAIKKLK